MVLTAVAAAGVFSCFPHCLVMMGGREAGRLQPCFLAFRVDTEEGRWVIADLFFLPLWLGDERRGWVICRPYLFACFSWLERSERKEAAEGLLDIVGLPKKNIDPFYVVDVFFLLPMFSSARPRGASLSHRLYAVRMYVRTYVLRSSIGGVYSGEHPSCPPPLLLSLVHLSFLFFLVLFFVLFFVCFSFSFLFFLVNFLRLHNILLIVPSGVPV